MSKYMRAIHINYKYSEGTHEIFILDNLRYDIREEYDMSALFTISRTGSAEPHLTTRRNTRFA